MNVCTTIANLSRSPFAVLALAATLLSGCSSSVAPGVTGISNPAVQVPVLITDAPSDQLVAFTLTLNSIILTDSAGKTTSILSTPTTIEVCHLNGIQAALVTASIPQDTYVSATITFSNPQITYIDATTKLPVTVTPTLGATSYTVTFPSAIAISNSNTSLLFDLLASQSVTISGTTVTVTPVFGVKPVPASTTLPMPGRNATGMEQRGAVVSASGTTLVIQPPSGANVKFTTDASTTYQGVSSLTALTAGQLVEVDFALQTGGVLLATRVELEPTPAGASQNQIGGPVTSVSANTFKMVLMQGMGPAVSPVASSAVSLFTVNFTTSTTFSTTPQFVALTGLPFTPTFSAATLKAGQVVDVTPSSISGTTATATNVVLDPQTLSGTVSAISTSGSWKVYTITLASGSAFASLSGATSVTVYTSAATVVPPSATTPPAIAVGSNVRFNGLVFYNSGSFVMVAGCSPDGDPSH